MRVDVVSILPEMFSGPMSASMVGIARNKGLLDFHVHDLRDWAHDKHRTTDDYPYGGGPGMVMKPEPVFEALDAVSAMHDCKPLVIFFAPAGQRFDQTIAEEFSCHDRLLLVCGRYEGFDARCLSRADRVISIGDYVLTGGELAAMVVVDAAVRLIPGALGHDMSAVDESFSTGLLEYPQYTRPAVYRGLEVPAVLRSGDHARIERWRREQSLRVTARVRPDLLDRVDLRPGDREIVKDELSTDSPYQEGI